MPRCIVTRPLAQSPAWVAGLKEAGLPALALPLIAIGPATDALALETAWRTIQQYDAIMFVSANAVAHFFAARPVDMPLPEALHGRPCWVTGPGSRQALSAAGIASDAIQAPPADAEQFDSEALWHRIAPQWRAGMHVLIVRGDAPGLSQDSVSGVGREWFAAQVRGQGGRCSFVVAYQRVLPALSANALALIQVAAGDGSVWIFSSSEAVENLRHLVPGQNWQDARAVATHARIAQAAQSAGFGRVVVSRPSLSSVIASIESLS